MNPLKTALPVALVALLTIAGCGGEDAAVDERPDVTDVDEFVDQTPTDDDPFAAPATPTEQDPLAGSTTPTEGTVDLPDPCTLLTADEATAVVGGTVAPTSAEPLLGSQGSQCRHLAPSGSTVTVRVEPGREAYDIGRGLGTGGFAEPGDIQDVSGLGEAAYVGIGSYGPVRIAWYQDGIALTVEISDVGATEPRTIPEYEDVAHRVSDRVA